MQRQQSDSFPLIWCLKLCTNDAWYLLKWYNCWHVKYFFFKFPVKCVFEQSSLKFFISSNCPSTSVSRFKRGHVKLCLKWAFGSSLSNPSSWHSALAKCWKNWSNSVLHYKWITTHSMLQKQPKSFSLQENVIFIISYKSPDVNPTEDASFYWKIKLNVGRPLPEVSSC